MYTMVTISSRGTITIPASVRKALGITGSQKVQLSFDEQSQRIIISLVD